MMSGSALERHSSFYAVRGTVTLGSECRCFHPGILLQLLKNLDTFDVVGIGVVSFHLTCICALSSIPIPTQLSCQLVPGLQRVHPISLA